MRRMDGSARGVQPDSLNLQFDFGNLSGLSSCFWLHIAHPFLTKENDVDESASSLSITLMHNIAS
jgi:hypothetical protein